MTRTLFTTISIFTICFGISFSETGSARYEKEMIKYKQTEMFENCIFNRSIKRTKVLDDSNIIFEMRNNRVYLNTFNQRCPPLRFSDQFAYKPTNNRLCNFDIISVFDSSGPKGSCGLGKFELLEKLPEDNG